VNALAIASAIGSLGFGALVGAMAGALAAPRLRERADARLRDRESRGLLRLVDSEMVHNEFSRLNLAADIRYWEEGNTTAFRTDAWEASRVRLAQLLPVKDFNAVAEYYSSLLTLLDALRHYHQERGGDKTYPEVAIQELIGGLGTSWEFANPVMDKYVEDRA
jgi:hypothetical protein